MKVLEIHGKELCFRKIKGKKDEKFEKITDESATAFNFSGNRHEHFMHYNAGKYVK